MKYLLLCLLVAFPGCWMFERTDERVAPIVEAAQNAATAAMDTAQDAIVIPGVPNWITAGIAGGVAGIAAFVSTLARRKRELDAKPVATPPPSTPGA